MRRKGGCKMQYILTQKPKYGQDVDYDSMTLDVRYDARMKLADRVVRKSSILTQRVTDQVLENIVGSNKHRSRKKR